MQELKERQFHKEILSESQAELLPVLKRFKDDFGLVGGTAIALQIGHRESIDFDMFTRDPKQDFSASAIRNKFKRAAIIGREIRAREFELTFVCIGVQVTFFNFDYVIPFTKKLDTILEMPDLLSLAAMKAFALGHRAKWKDYVDLYFIMRDYHQYGEIVERASELFGLQFNERLLRQQLGFFDDINYQEEVIYKDGFVVQDNVIKDFLREVSLS